jgi:hypothetical protein
VEEGPIQKMPKRPTVQTLSLIIRPDLIFLSLLLGACSGAEFAGSGASSATDGKDQKNTEQPSDVAGGFGLTCNSSDSTSNTDVLIGCTFASKTDGTKFQESSTIKLLVSVKNSGNDLPVSMSAATDASNFSFSAPKEELNNIRIRSTFVDPSNGDKTLTDIAENLSNVLIPMTSVCTPNAVETQSCVVANGTGGQSRTCSSAGSWGSFGACSAISCDAGFNWKAGSCAAPPTWVDVTTTTSGAPSTCAANQDRCSKKLSDSSLWWSKVFPGGTHNGAAQNCDGLTHNGKSDWRLPTYDELLGMCNSMTWPFVMSDNAIDQQAFFHTMTPGWTAGMYFMIGFGTDQQGSSFCNFQGQTTPNASNSQLTMKHICVSD